MATKTFKIGLSNTDKQNMAQDIYEQVEALLFDEYDSSETYHENDFVVYNNKLYICIASSTTGTWDATKWQEAKLQDLVDLVNEGVASIDGKADTSDLLDGTIVVSKSLSAQELENVSEESGNTQEEPFIYQGTGTANGTASVDTSPVGKQLEKQGNTVAVNQLLSSTQTQSRTSSGYNLAFNGSTYKVSIATTTASESEVQVVIIDASSNTTILVPNHYYLVKFDDLPVGCQFKSDYANNSMSYQSKSYILQNTRPENYYFNIRAKLVGNISYESDLRLVDLTQWFNGNIPQDILDHPENFSRYYQGSLAYNTGTLENCDGRYLECGGRNVWDEEWEVGQLNTDGSNQSASSSIRSKNYIQVIPNTDYYYKVGTGGYLVICYYDVNKVFIERLYGYSRNQVYKTSANACFVRFAVVSGYGTTYNNDITISLYYTTGDGYDQYYPYVEPKVYDTGTEVLRRIPVANGDDIFDTKLPDGTITRKIQHIDLGGDDISWVYDGDYDVFVSTTIKGSANGTPFFADSYENKGAVGIGDLTNMSGTLRSGALYVKNTSYTNATTFKTAMSGKYIDIPLATPTTEQGTTFSENIEIDDYGTMGWKDTNEEYVAIPQGCKIFYPAWYAGFIDSLGQREDIEWDAGNVVSQTQLSSSETARDSVDTQLKNAIGGTLRQCLCVKETLDFEDTDVVDLGDFTWNYTTMSGQAIFLTNLSGIAAKCLCTKYNSTYSASQSISSFLTSNKEIYMEVSAERILVRDTDYTNATDFKNAMKGVLLAYEKA